jgi:predicted O-methyltransferase YrrM
MVIAINAGVTTALTKAESIQLDKLAAAKRVLECGSEWGASTICLAQKADLVISVDWQGGDPCTGDRSLKRRESSLSWIHNLFAAQVMHKVIPILGKFEDVLPLLAPGSFDMAFLDGDHRYEAVVRDIQLILPLLKPKAILAVHDYGRDYGTYPDGSQSPTRFGVTQVLDKFAKEKDLELYHIDHLAWVKL